MTPGREQESDRAFSGLILCDGRLAATNFVAWLTIAWFDPRFPF